MATALFHFRVRHRKKFGHLGIVEDLNLGPPERQPSLLTTKPCQLHLINLSTKYAVLDIKCKFEEQLS